MRNCRSYLLEDCPRVRFVNIDIEESRLSLNECVRCKYGWMFVGWVRSHHGFYIGHFDETLGCEVFTEVPSIIVLLTQCA